MVSAKGVNSMIKPLHKFVLIKKEEKDSQNIFVKAGTWIKDLFGSIGVSIKNTATGLYKTAKEGYDERKEAVDIWTKLEQLNAIAQPLAVYSQNMSQKKLNVLKENIIRDLLFMSLGIVMLIAASFQYPEWTQFFIFLDIIYTCYYCWISHFSNTLSMYRTEKQQFDQVHNPFLSPLYVLPVTLSNAKSFN